MANELINTADEQQMFHLQHSRAFVQFSALEQQLANLVTMWSLPPDSSILFESFYGIEMFRSKLEFLDRFMLHHLKENKPATEAWQAARNASKKAAEGRNKLAHWYMKFYPDGKPGQRFVLVPPSVNPGDKISKDGTHGIPGKAPGYAIKIEGIAQIAQNCVDAWALTMRAKAAALGYEDPFQGINIPGKVEDLKGLVAQYRSMDNMLQMIRTLPDSDRSNNR